MIEIKNVTKIFNKSKYALNDINLKLNDKGMIFITGKSGSGKSTLLNLIANYDTPTSGEILFDGINISSLKEKERDSYLFNEVGFVFQAYNLFEDLTVKENIALGLKDNVKNIEDNIKDLLKEVKLENYENRKVKNLSGGEKQRVALARALIKNPTILLCDEPCGNLDNVNSRIVLDILKNRSKSSLVLIISHSLNDAYLFADRIINLNEGKVSSDKYIDYNDKNDDYYIINDLNNISDDEFHLIYDNIKNDKLKGIKSRKYLFKDFNLDLNINKKEKKNKKHNFIKSLFINLKLINSKFMKIFVFSLITALSLALFSSIYTLEKFDGNNYMNEALKLNDSNIIYYSKGFKDNDGYQYGVYETNFDNKDEEFIKQNYDKKYYKRLRGFIGSNSTRYSIANETSLNYTHFDKFYAIELNGINVVDEAFLKKLLKIDNIEIIYNNDNKDAIYITDYFADSLLYFNHYKDYDELMYRYNNTDYKKCHNFMRIKGIIKTNYKEQLKVVFDLFNENKNLVDFLKKEENFKYFDYLKNVLACGYSFDEEFINDSYCSVYIYNILLDDNINLRYFNYYKLNTLMDNTLLISIDYIRKYYPKLSVDEIRVLLNNKTFKMKLVTKGFDELKPRLNKDVNIRLMEDYLDVIKQENAPKTSFYASKDLFNDFIKDRFSTTGLYFDDASIYNLNEQLEDLHIKINTPYSIFASKVESEVNKFIDVFKILDLFSLFLCLFIMIYYAFSVIKDNKYNIGVLKSLGYSGNELSICYLVSFLFYFIITIILYGITYYNLSILLNDVLVKSFTLGFNIALITSIPFISFSVSLFIVVSISLLVSSLLFSLIYLFVLRKYKIINVIQNKE